MPPNSADDPVRRGMALGSAGRYDEAAQSFRQAIALRPKDLDARFGFARSLFAAGKPGEGLVANRAALAVAHETLPRLDQLAAVTRHAISIDPGFAEAYRTLSMMVRRTAYDDEMGAMEKLYADPRSTAEQRMHLGFALGRGFDDIGRWQQAFDHFAAGNRLKRDSIAFSLDARLDEVARIGKQFETLPPLPPVTGEPGPIFVVGLPRSGKTTVEQLLARHPDVAGLGEVEILDDLATPFLSRNRDLSAVSAPDFAGIGANYRTESQRLRPGARVTVDTTPANFRYVGLLRLALPNARIIHCVRDPLEHAVALFQKFFASPVYDYSYDLAEIAAYRRACVGIMAQWKAQFAGFVLDIDITALAADPETQVRRLLAFCGLPYDPACLDLRNPEQRLREKKALEPAVSPRDRLAPYSAVLSPLL